MAETRGHGTSDDNHWYHMETKITLQVGEYPTSDTSFASSTTATRTSHEERFDDCTSDGFTPALL